MTSSASTAPNAGRLSQPLTRQDAKARGGSPRLAAQRIEALGEAAQVVRILWGGGGSFSGRWYQPPDAPGYRDTARAEGLPILIGGH